jgi:hypothetical protein
MSFASLSMEQVHARAVEMSSAFRRGEAELVDVLIRIEIDRVFLLRGHASLFAYVTGELGISENTAYSLITVARKVREVPELGVKFRAGEITLSKARRVAAVLTVANQEEWIAKACALSTRGLEREIARVRPRAQVFEQASYVGADRLRLTVGISEAQMLELRHAQDLLCQSRRRAVSLEETIGVMTAEFLKRKDPVRRAKRQKSRGKVSPIARVGELVTPGRVQAHGGESPSVRADQLVAPKRTPIPAAVLHAVNLRDQRRCTQRLPNGTSCGQRRWVDIHHVEWVSRGGANDIDNLVTLCSSHHQLRHLNAGCTERDGRT